MDAFANLGVDGHSGQEFFEFASYENTMLDGRCMLGYLKSRIFGAGVRRNGIHVRQRS